MQVRNTKSEVELERLREEYREKRRDMRTKKTKAVVF